MVEPKPTREIVSVSEMARLLGLSRSRFYQLVKQGIFPSPSTSDSIKRPFYDRAAQEHCLEIRRTGQGLDGRPILFYSVHRRETPSLVLRKTPRPSSSRPSAPAPSNDPIIEQLQVGLKQLGLEADNSIVHSALTRCFPSGLTEVSPEHALITIFRQLRCELT